MSSEVCFRQGDFKLYVLLYVLILGYLLYIAVNYTDTSELKGYFQTAVDNIQVRSVPVPVHVPVHVPVYVPTDNKNIETGPERIYPGGRLDMPSNMDYQQIGFIFNENARYPLYGRPRYPGRTDKYEYYIVDQSRNRLKIPIPTNNYEELFDSDTVQVKELNSTFNIKLYEYAGLRYIG
ncbi:hypothetical protein EB118_03070 [bacterium]|nr:hypothetical protein [bacterium]NDD83441.1 hypothetical protein [bacterium]NDG29066.1 hypothetical protein [bacterium]